MSVTASALTNTFSRPGALMKENFADVLDVRFKDIATRMWKQPVEGLKYFKEESTDRAYEKYSAVTGLGIVPKSRDVDEVPLGHKIQGFDTTITPEVYRLGMRIEQRLRETDQFGVIDNMMEALNMSAKDTIELYAALPFNTAFSSTVEWVCADGLQLVETSRPYEDGAAGTWSNEETSAVLSQAAIAAMRLNFAKNRNERGLKRPLRMEKIVIPPDLEDTAITELGSVLKPGSSLNDKNYLTKYGINYEVWNYLTSSAYWFGMAPKDNLYELKWLWGKKPEVKAYETGNPDVYAKRIRMIYATGCVRPHSIRGNLGA